MNKIKEMDSQEQSQLTHMFQLAVESRKRAHCPYSNFAVGACLLASNGKLYTGCNVENAVNGMSLCAEGTAIVKMVEDGCKQIVELVVVTGLEGHRPAAPCGLCRQHIKEFSEDDVHNCTTQSKLKIHLTNLDGKFDHVTLEELMPRSFGPKHLGR